MKKMLIFTAILLLASTLFTITTWAALTQTQVSQLYVGVMGRAAEGDGNRYWQTDPSSTDMTTTANIMLNTPTAKEYFGDKLYNNRLFVEHIYLYTFGKTYADDPNGIDYWIGELDTGYSKARTIHAIITAVQHPANADSGQARFNNRVAVSNYCADNIVSFTDQETFEGFISGVTHDSATVTSANAAVDKSALTDFSISTLSGQAPLSVYMETKTLNYNNLGLSHNWTYDSVDSYYYHDVLFGAGSEAHLELTEPGEYRITLSVSYNRGGGILGTASKIVVVEEAPIQEPFSINKSITTSAQIGDACEEPVLKNVFDFEVEKVTQWINYSNAEIGKENLFNWISPNGTIVYTTQGKLDYTSGCTWGSIPKNKIQENGSGQWSVKFYYDGQLYKTNTFEIGEETKSKKTITWAVTDKCDDGYYIEYKFWNSDRNLYWGPYKSSGYENTGRKTLNCVDGEKVCFGGKTGSKSWGVGYDGKNGCDTCCGTCDGGTYTYNPSCRTTTPVPSPVTPVPPPVTPVPSPVTPVPSPVTPVPPPVTPVPPPVTPVPPPVTPDYGCYKAGQCISMSSKWSKSGGFTSSYTNNCQGRVYIRFCNERGNSQRDDCGASGLRKGSTKKWTTYSDATGRYKAFWIGSEKSGSDWVCADNVDGWNDPMF